MQSTAFAFGVLWASASLAAQGAGGSASCREMMADYTVTATSGASRHDTSGHCSFDRAAHNLHCTLQSRDARGNTAAVATDTRYRSVGEFVDEVRVVPPLMKSTAIMTTQQAGGMSFSENETHEYDAQGRLLRIVRAAGKPGAATTTASNWDAAGRPQTTQTTMRGGTARLDIQYDDAARTSTTRVNGNQSVTVETFDANGNPTSSVIRGGGQETTRLYRISATERVCR